MEPSITIEIITPEYARAMLALSASAGFENRKLSQRLIDKYAAEMLAGRWECTGQTISISGDGSVIDGQHRLHATIKSGVSIKCAVARGVDKDNFDKYDIGKARTPGDVLFIRGYTHSPALLAASARNIMAYLATDILGSGGAMCAAQMPLDDYFPIIETFRHELENGANFYFNVKPKTITQSNLIAAHVLFGYVDQEKRDSFFSHYRNGGSVESKIPPVMLKEFFTNNRISQTIKMRPEAEASFIIDAWNKFIQGKRTGRYSLKVKIEKNIPIYGFDRDSFINSIKFPDLIKKRYFSK